MFVVEAAIQGTVRLEEIFKGILPFIVMDVLGIAIMIGFPEFLLWLPNLTYGG